MNSFLVNIVTDQESWINKYVPTFIEELLGKKYEVFWCHRVEEVKEGDISFYLSFGQVVPSHVLRKSKQNLGVHESDLPEGRGWSPLTWKILEGKNKIPIVLFEVSEKVDSGSIYMKRELVFKGTELIDEMREAQAKVTLDMCSTFLEKYPSILQEARPQKWKNSYYRRRFPEDSRLNSDQTIREQFNLLRVVDNERYPAFFEIDGERYILSIKRGKKP